MSRRYLIGIAVIATLLTGCGPQSTAVTPTSEPGKGDASFTEVHRELSDGRTVVCLLWDADAGYDSGLSCDWANASAPAD